MNITLTEFDKMYAEAIWAEELEADPRHENWERVRAEVRRVNKYAPRFAEKVIRYLETKHSEWIPVAK